MGKKILLLDVDEVICFSGFLDAINEFLGTNYKVDDFNVYYLDKEIIPEEQFDDFTSFVSLRNNYENPTILPGAIETIELLNKFYEIFICSSCINFFNPSGSAEAFKNKFNFLVNVLPFIHPSKYIFTDSKKLIRGDIIIDDRVSNLESDIETKILFPSYHNKGISDIELENKGIIRAGYDWKNGWKEVEKILIKK